MQRKILSEETFYVTQTNHVREPALALKAARDGHYKF